MIDHTTNAIISTFKNDYNIIHALIKHNWDSLGWFYIETSYKTATNQNQFLDTLGRVRKISAVWPEEFLADRKGF